MSPLVLMRAGAIFLALIVINLYYELLALPVAEGFSTLKADGIPLLLLLLVGFVTVFGGGFATVLLFMSRRLRLVLLASVTAVVTAMPFLGMVAQEVALKGAK